MKPFRSSGIVRRYMAVALVSGFLVSTVMVLPVQAQAGASGVSSIRGVALVIGNAAYKKTTALANPVNDANDIAAAMKKLGWQVIVQTDATLSGMKQAVRDFAGKLKGQPAGFFYYAGHGVQFDGVNYLVPIDADIQLKAETQASTISMDFVLQAMEETGVPVKMVVLDACRDNPFEKTRSVAGASRGLALVGSQPKGTVLVYATGPGDVSLDGSGRNGVFTESFLPHLATPGLEFREIIDLTGASVQEKTGGKQTPWINSSYFGKLYLVSPEEAGAMAGERLSSVQSELEKLAKQQEAIVAAQASAKDEAERLRLEQEAKVLAAKDAQARLEASMLEKAQLAAAARADEEARNRAQEAARVRDAEVQLATLRKQAEERRSLMGSGVAGDDLSRTYYQLLALDEAVTEISSRFNASRDVQLDGIKAAYDKRIVQIDAYTKDPWENAKEFEQRKTEAKMLAKRDLERESGALRADYEDSIKRETASLRTARSDLENSLPTRNWAVKASDLKVTRSNFDEDQKSWTFTILGSGTAAGLEAKAVYKISYKSMSELATAYKKLDAAWTNKLLEPRALVGLGRQRDGTWWASIKETSILDMSTGEELVKATIVKTPPFIPPPPVAVPGTVVVENAPILGALKLGDQSYDFKGSRGGRVKLDKVQSLVNMPVQIVDMFGTPVDIEGVSRIMLGEGEEKTIELPGGWLSMPRLPDGSWVGVAYGDITESIGNYSGKTIKPDAFRRIRVEEGMKLRLPPGIWTVGLYSPIGAGISGFYPEKVTVTDGGLVQLTSLREKVLKDINLQRQSLLNLIKKAQERKITGWVALGGSAAGAALSYASHMLGSAAMELYHSATTTAAVQAARSDAEMWGVLMPLSAGAGAASLLWSTSLLTKGDKESELRRDLGTVNGYLKAMKGD